MACLMDLRWVLALLESATPQSMLSITLLDGQFRLDSLRGGLALITQSFAAIIIIATIGHIRWGTHQRGIGSIQIESYLIFFTTLIGMNFLIHSNDWIVTIVSWELFNLSLYLLVSVSYGSSESTLSAALKYFLLSAFSTGMLLMGVLILYAVTGCTHYDSITLILHYEHSAWIHVAYVLILGCLLFKLSAAPLHNWAPDLYDALPTGLTLWMAIIPKLTV